MDRDCQQDLAQQKQKVKNVLKTGGPFEGILLAFPIYQVGQLLANCSQGGTRGKYQRITQFGVMSLMFRSSPTNASKRAAERKR